MAKCFRSAKLLSSSRFWPYARRFDRAARRLRALGIRTVAVTAMGRQRTTGRDVIVYDPLPGASLRDLIRDQPERIRELLPIYTRMLATLHDKGVYFRSVHFGNVIIDSDDEAGLIDLTATHFFRGPLSPSRRARNLKPPLNYDVDAAAIEQVGPAAYLRSYFDAASLPAAARVRMLGCLHRQHPLWRSCRPSDIG